MHKFDSIQLNELLDYILQTDITKLISSINVTAMSENECSVAYCIITKSEGLSCKKAFKILFTRMLVFFEGWDEVYGGNQSPIFIDKHYLNKMITDDYVYINNNCIQFESLSIDITAEQFANSLYYMELDKNSDFQNDIMAKFPIISLLEIVDFPDSFMPNLEYLIETESHYIYVTSYCSA